MVTVKEALTAIADAIRSVLGIEEKRTLMDMSNDIYNISDTGYACGYFDGEEFGWQNGFDEGNIQGYEVGYSTGQGEQYDEFWDGVQNYGKRTNYNRAFSCWGCEEIKPKYKVVPTSGNGIFEGCGSMERIDKDSFDLSQATYGPTTSQSLTYALCDYCYKLEVFPDIGLQPGYLAATFEDNLALHTIEVLRMAEDVLTTSYAFRNCSKLANLTIEGVIGRNFPISAAPLTVESMKSIITHLKDYSGTDKAGTYTLTLKDTCKTELQANTETIEFTKNDGTVVTCTYFELVTTKGWNLA